VTGSAVLGVVAYIVAVAVVGAASVGKRAARAVRAVPANLPARAAVGFVHARACWLPTALAARSANTSCERSW
jgi:hypothetical protein